MRRLAIAALLSVAAADGQGGECDSDCRLERLQLYTECARVSVHTIADNPVWKRRLQAAVEGRVSASHLLAQSGSTAWLYVVVARPKDWTTGREGDELMVSLRLVKWLKDDFGNGALAFLWERQLSGARNFDSIDSIVQWASLNTDRF